MAEWPNAVVLKTIEPKGSGFESLSLRHFRMRSLRSFNKGAEDEELLFEMRSEDGAFIQMIAQRCFNCSIWQTLQDKFKLARLAVSTSNLSGCVSANEGQVCDPNIV